VGKGVCHFSDRALPAFSVQDQSCERDHIGVRISYHDRQPDRAQAVGIIRVITDINNVL
jgi:hypothetical protein